MSVILSKVVYTSASSKDEVNVILPSVPVLKEYNKGDFTLYLPARSALSARIRLIREFIRRGYSLTNISNIRACNASFKKEL